MQVEIFDSVKRMQREEEKFERNALRGRRSPGEPFTLVNVALTKIKGSPSFLNELALKHPLQISDSFIEGGGVIQHGLNDVQRALVIIVVR